MLYRDEPDEDGDYTAFSQNLFAGAILLLALLFSIRLWRLL